jgi:nucleoside-diphosphate-sugar epimerase
MAQLDFPSHFKTILVTGAGGFVGRQLVQLLLSSAPGITLITTDVSTPPNYGVQDEGTLLCLAADLGNKEQVKGLFQHRPIEGVFALQ